MAEKSIRTLEGSMEYEATKAERESPLGCIGYRGDMGVGTYSTPIGRGNLKVSGDYIRHQPQCLYKDTAETVDRYKATVLE